MWGAAVLCLAAGVCAAQEATPSKTESARVSYRFHHVHFVGGGFITGILFHPTVKGLAYCRTDIGGAYRWDEAAQRWTSLSEWIPMEDANLIGVESLAVDPAHPDDLYLAAGTYAHDDSPNGALLRSHDRGKTFDIIKLPFRLGANEEGRFAGERLAVDPVHAGTLYLGTRLDGLWRSGDSGSTWSKVSAFPGHTENGVGIPFVLFGLRKDGSAGAIYAGVSAAEENLWVSEDGGATWQRGERGSARSAAEPCSDGCKQFTLCDLREQAGAERHDGGSRVAEVQGGCVEGHHAGGGRGRWRVWRAGGGSGSAGNGGSLHHGPVEAGRHVISHKRWG